MSFVFSELYYDRSNHHEFASLSKLLLYPGEITDTLSLDFNFPSVDKPYESYNGVNVRLRLLLRLYCILIFERFHSYFAFVIEIDIFCD